MAALLNALSKEAFWRFGAERRDVASRVSNVQVLDAEGSFEDDC